jgi:hypothetical protein
MCRSPARQFRFLMDRMKTPNRLLYALRYFIGVALPFIGELLHPNAVATVERSGPDSRFFQKAS